MSLFMALWDLEWPPHGPEKMRVRRRKKGGVWHEPHAELNKKHRESPKNVGRLLLCLWHYLLMHSINWSVELI